MHIHTGFCHNEIPALLAFAASAPAVLYYCKCKFKQRFGFTKPEPCSHEAEETDQDESEAE